MFIHFLWVLFKHVGLPLGIILISRDRFGDPRITFFIVNIVLTLTTLPLVIWQLIKLIPNLALLRPEPLFRDTLEIVVEVGSVIGFWLAFAYIFN